MLTEECHKNITNVTFNISSIEGIETNNLSLSCLTLGWTWNICDHYLLWVLWCSFSGGVKTDFSPKLLTFVASSISFGFSKKYTFRIRLIKQIWIFNAFEEDLYNLVRNIEFKRANTIFQNQLNKDINMNNQNPLLFIPADKSNSF